MQAPGRSTGPVGGIETTAVGKLDSYQNLAKAFRVAAYAQRQRNYRRLRPSRLFEVVNLRSQEAKKRDSLMCPLTLL